jgi:putative transcriptional regulator
MRNRLRVLRAGRGWSQAELASRLGVSRQTVNAIEKERHDPVLPLAFGIARLFALRLEEIFLLDEPARSGMRIVEVPEAWRTRVRIVAGVAAEELERFLTPRERDDLEELKVPARRLERAASRIAGKMVADEVFGIRNPTQVEFVKDGDRPVALLRGEPAPFSVSFTHSHGLGAAALGEAPVGVDLEKFRPIRPEMTRFFLSDAELAVAAGIDLPHPLLHYWAAKEAAFKADGRFPTLLKVPLELVRAGLSGLTLGIAGTSFLVETTILDGEFVAALAVLGARR